MLLNLAFLEELSITKGTTGTKVWDLNSRRAVEVPSSAWAFRGATSQLVWLKRDDETSEPLVFGTQAGFLVAWSDSKGKVCAQRCPPQTRN